MTLRLSRGQEADERSDFRDLLRCAGYSSALTAAQDALRQGDKEAALRKLREARALLSSCSRGADTASTSERAIARAPRGAAAFA